MKTGTTPVKGFFYTFSSSLFPVTVYRPQETTRVPQWGRLRPALQGALWNRGAKAMSTYGGQPWKPEKKNKCETGVQGCGFQRREERTVDSGSKKVCLQKHFLSITLREGGREANVSFGGK